MIAASMAALLVVEGFGWWLLASWLASRGLLPDWSVPLAAPAMYAGLRLLLVLVSFGLARLFRGAPWPPLPAAGWICCIAQEWLAVLRHHLLALPFHRLLPMPVAGPRQDERPVLFLHGLANNAGVWRPILARLARSGLGNLFTMTYGPPWSTIDAFADQVAAEVEAICRGTGSAQLRLVGHSMGGLVARSYMQRHGAARVSCLVTLGTPHRGSLMAHFAVGACGAQLLPDSEWMLAWASCPAPAVPCVSIYSLHDNLVVPQSSPELPGVEWVPIAGVGHNAMHYSRAFHAALATALGAPGASPLPPTSGSPG